MAKDGKRERSDALARTKSTRAKAGNLMLKLDEQEHADDNLAMIIKQEPEDDYDENIHKCHLCSLRYKTQASLDQHLSSHTTLKHECHICHKRFRLKSNCDKHIALHSDVRNFPCMYCSDSYEERSLLEAHLYDHIAVEVNLTDSTIPQTYRCDTCDTDFTDVVIFNTHLVEHEMAKAFGDGDISQDADGSQFSCHQCALKFPSRRLLNKHIVRHTTFRYGCDVCYKRFRDKDVRDKHVAIHLDRKYKCMHCDNSYDRRSRLARHMYTHVGVKEKKSKKMDESSAECPAEQHQCYICGLDFTDYSLFAKHMVKHEINSVYGEETAEREIHGCHLCGLKYQTRRQLTSHIAKHSKKQYACDVCHMRFRDKEVCDRHRTVHSSDRKYKCSQCSNSYDKRRFLMKHLYTHVRAKQMTKENATSDGTTASSSYQCSICGTEFKDVSLFDTHMVKHEMATVEAQQNKESNESTKIRYCSFGDCRRYFLTLAELEDHVAAKHDGCPICGKHFISSLLIKKHMIAIHKNKENSEENANSVDVEGLANKIESRKFPCSLCKRSFREPSDLHKHYQRVHHKPFKCPGHCNRMFGSRTQVRYHVMEYSNAKPYTCNICGRQFITKHTYQVHMIIHSGRKPFRCHVCGSGFPEKQRLDRHMISHMSERNFICETCNKPFKSERSRNQHALRHLSTRPHVCMRCHKGFLTPSHLYRHIKENCHTPARKLINKNM